jgi:hypothetical protein
MKNLGRKIASNGALFVALWTAQTAMAWYDPSTGRWLNRDPIGEPGFQVMQRAGSSITSASTGRWIHRDGTARLGANQYLFNLNDPCDFVDPEGLTVWVCSRKTDWGIGNHVYFYDDGAPAGHSPSCSQQNKSGGAGTVTGHDIPPSDPNSHCTPVEGTGDPGEENDRGRAIMSCCEDAKRMNSGPYIPFANDCHNHLDKCLSAGGNYYPIRHPRLGGPTVTPIFTPMPLTPRMATP